MKWPRLSASSDARVARRAGHALDLRSNCVVVASSRAGADSDEKTYEKFKKAGEER
ncbi:hypothetical protein [Dietzia sp. NCCP-2495]|uniref:hypothetical protein n=1 Tax=Dietzia sp. NCCP-2495 TaxID=2934675 RepID=UPI0022301C4F|nr:hypothetical protein [Dietzia sp. NCCP-2495]